jgi:hypothetical protein
MKRIIEDVDRLTEALCGEAEKHSFFMSPEMIRAIVAVHTRTLDLPGIEAAAERLKTHHEARKFVMIDPDGSLHGLLADLSILTAAALAGAADRPAFDEALAYQFAGQVLRDSEKMGIAPHHWQQLSDRIVDALRGWYERFGATNQTGAPDPLDALEALDCLTIDPANAEDKARVERIRRALQGVAGDPDPLAAIRTLKKWVGAHGLVSFIGLRLDGLEEEIMAHMDQAKEGR